MADAGFDAGSPTVWLAEGLLQYLSADAERALFERVHDLSAPGSHLVMERTANLAALVEGDNGRRMREISERTGVAMDQLVDREARPNPADWLAERGWTVTEHPVATIAERYGRDLKNPGLPRPNVPLPLCRIPGPQPRGAAFRSCAHSADARSRRHPADPRPAGPVPTSFSTSVR